MGGGTFAPWTRKKRKKFQKQTIKGKKGTNGKPDGPLFPPRCVPPSHSWPNSSGSFTAVQKPGKPQPKPQ